MFGLARLISFVTFLALLCPTLADTLYRYDTRGPAELKDSEGFEAKNPDGDGTVIQHVNNELGDDDPYVSTTKDIDFARGGTNVPHESYVYYIETSGLEMYDAEKEFDDADLEYTHPAEKEISVKEAIPWENIVKWETWKKSEKISETTREDWEKDNKKARMMLSMRFRA